MCDLGCETSSFYTSIGPSDNQFSLCWMPDHSCRTQVQSEVDLLTPSKSRCHLGRDFWLPTTFLSTVGNKRWCFPISVGLELILTQNVLEEIKESSYLLCGGSFGEVLK